MFGLWEMLMGKKNKQNSLYFSLRQNRSYEKCIIRHLSPATLKAQFILKSGEIKIWGGEKKNNLSSFLFVCSSCGQNDNNLHVLLLPLFGTCPECPSEENESHSKSVIVHYRRHFLSELFWTSTHCLYKILFLKNVLKRRKSSYDRRKLNSWNKLDLL